MSTFQKNSFLFLCFFVSIYFFSVSAYDRSTDSLALIALYDSTDGPSWDTNTNWLDSGYSITTWHGITVANDRVSQILLNNNNLNGPLPPEIGNLTELEYLSLQNNSLSGSIPTQIENLTDLTHLYLNNNNLSGSLPSGIGNLIKLQYLYLHYNSLTSSIPVNLGYLDSLKQLYLHYNNLSGSVPDTLGSIVNLENLYIYNNSFSGTLPSKLGNLSNLQNLYIQNNNFTNLGDSIVKLNDLNDLNIGNNEICQLSYNVERWADSMDTDWYQTQDCDSTTGDTAQGLLGYWKFDEGSDTIVNDYSGYNRDAAICGSGPYYVGDSIWQDGVDSYGVEYRQTDTNFYYLKITAPHSSEIQLKRDKTISIWVNFRDFPHSGYKIFNFMSKIGWEPCYTEGKVWGFSLQTFSKTTLYLRTDFQCGHAFYSGAVNGLISENEWNHYAVTISSNNLTFYINGSIIDTAILGAADTGNNGNYVLSMGRWNTGWNNGEATIDEARLYNRGLTSCEIYYIYSLNSSSYRGMPDNNGSQYHKNITTTLPTNFILQHNFPNPFSKTTTIKFAIPIKKGTQKEYPVKLQIFNTKGQLVKVLINEKLLSGYHLAFWDGTDFKGKAVKTGVYFYKLTSIGFVQSKKMYLAK